MTSSRSVASVRVGQSVSAARRVFLPTVVCVGLVMVVAAAGRGAPTDLQAPELFSPQRHLIEEPR